MRTQLERENGTSGYQDTRPASLLGPQGMNKQLQTLESPPCLRYAPGQKGDSRAHLLLPYLHI